MARFHGTACWITTAFFIGSGFLTPLRAVGSTSPVDRFFEGSIGRSKRIWLTLDIAGQKATGSYFVESTSAYVPDEISLKGSYSGGRLHLDRVTEDTKTGKEATTPALDGSLRSGTSSHPGASLAGSWREAGVSSAVPVKLVEQRMSPGPGLEFADRHLKEHVATKHYTIEATYPQLTGSSSGRVTAFNAAIRSLVRQLNAGFKKECAEMEPQRKETKFPDCTEDIGFRILAATPTLISLQIIDDAYMGGAHGMQIAHTINYDSRRHKILQLSELFGSAFLPAISKQSISALKRGNPDLYGEKMWVETLQEGAGPKAANYRNWNLTPYGLLITFEEYQVAPYAVGSPEVVIPYAALKPPAIARFVPHS